MAFFLLRAAALAAPLLAGLAASACSRPSAEEGQPPVPPRAAAPTPVSVPVPVPAPADPRSTGAPAPPPRASSQYAVSAVLGQQDQTMQSGKTVCHIRFVYAGREAEDLFWEEPCAAVTTTMVDRTTLEKYERWQRLDDFEQGFVQAMPGGKVLYVEGSFSAAVYPIDSTNTSIEVFVAD